VTLYISVYIYYIHMRTLTFEIFFLYARSALLRAAARKKSIPDKGFAPERELGGGGCGGEVQGEFDQVEIDVSRLVDACHKYMYNICIYTYMHLYIHIHTYRTTE